VIAAQAQLRPGRTWSRAQVSDFGADTMASAPVVEQKAAILLR
jgi:hypothetical protein